MADISKFGVPLGGDKLSMLQPKMQYKFRVVFLGIGYDADPRVLTQNVVSVARPSYTTDEVEVHSYNSIGYLEGKVRWQPTEITFRDDITNGVVTVLGQQTQKQMNHFEQTQAVAGANYKFVTEVHSLDGTNGEELESWRMDGCWLTGYTAPPGNYATSDSQIVTISLRFDVATQTAGPNTNDGLTVGGDPFQNTPSQGGAVGIA